MHTWLTTVKSIKVNVKSLNLVRLIATPWTVAYQDFPGNNTGVGCHFLRLNGLMPLVFNMLSTLVIAFLPRSKCLLISWLQSPSAVNLEPKKIKCVTVSMVTPCICLEVMGLNAMILVFWILSLSQLFPSPLSLSSRGSLVLLHFLP